MKFEIRIKVGSYLWEITSKFNIRSDRVIKFFCKMKRKISLDYHGKMCFFTLFLFLFKHSTMLKMKREKKMNLPLTIFDCMLFEVCFVKYLRFHHCYIEGKITQTWFSSLEKSHNTEVSVKIDFQCGFPKNFPIFSYFTSFWKYKEGEEKWKGMRFSFEANYTILELDDARNFKGIDFHKQHRV